MSFVTLAEVKAVGRIDYDTHDTELQMLLDACEEFVEEHCCISLTSKTITGERVDGGLRQLWPRVLPITSVTKIIDEWVGSTSTVVASDYIVQDTRIVAADGWSFSPGELRYKVDYVAGYTAATAPKGLKPAIIGLVLLSYNNAEGKGNQAAAGYGCSFTQLQGGNDIIDRLEHFSLRRFVE